MKNMRLEISISGNKNFCNLGAKVSFPKYMKFFNPEAGKFYFPKYKKFFWG